ncbi:hypothetical protein BC834DRAFT_164963 [Gloeopeniophorella convolvens]|nr:hypothetical protein BC834DRAFT_164963 [Gloeopeniophorella convolvens]
MARALLLFVSFATLVASGACGPAHAKRGVDPSLVPQFGWQAGVNPTDTGNCDGAVDGPNGLPIEVPCSCPPDRTLFINDVSANVAAGHAVNNTGVQVVFPTDNSIASQLQRLTVASITLQNMLGLGVGCPVESTTFAAQQTTLLNELGVPSGPPPSSTVSATPPPSSTPVSSSSTVSSSSSASAPSSTPTGALTQAQVAAVAPPLGWQAGINPTGSGDCDGAVDGSDGLPVKIPCFCPPDQDTYISQLTANANLGHAVRNPGATLTFPLDGSVGSQLARLNAAAVTLQNLNGSGIGCPIQSTTFSVQQIAIMAAA